MSHNGERFGRLPILELGEGLDYAEDFSGATADMEYVYEAWHYADCAVASQVSTLICEDDFVRLNGTPEENTVLYTLKPDRGRVGAPNPILTLIKGCAGSDASFYIHKITKTYGQQGAGPSLKT